MKDIVLRHILQRPAEVEARQERDAHSQPS